MLLEVKGVTKKFGGLTAVDNFSIEIEKGTITGLIGPNGAGKTTVFNLLTGIYPVSSGSIVLDEQDITNNPSHVITQKGLTRTFQNIKLFNNMTVFDNVRIGHHCRGSSNLLGALFRPPSTRREEKEMSERTMSLLEDVGLADRKDELASNLSYGMQRKLEIARALASEPKILLLDEPAAGMNPNETQELMDTIRFVREHFDMTVLLIEHDMKLVGGICEELTVLNFGQVLIQGETSAVLKDPTVITAYLGE